VWLAIEKILTLSSCESEGLPVLFGDCANGGLGLFPEITSEADLH